MKLFTRCALFILLICIQKTMAQDMKDGKPLTLREASRLAEQNYPLIKAGEYYTKSVAEEIRAVQLESLPSLKLHEQVGYATANSLAGTYFPFGTPVSVSGSITTKNNNDASFGSISMLYSELPLYTFGQHNAKVKLYKLQTDLARAGQSVTLYQHIARTIDAFLSMRAYIDIRKSQEKNLQRAAHIRTLIVANTIGGLRPGVDSMIANADVSRARIALLDAIKNERSQRFRLCRLMGVTDTSFNLDSGLTGRTPFLPVVNKVSANPVLEYYRQREEIGTAREKYLQKSFLPRINFLSTVWGRGSGINYASGGGNSENFTDGASLRRYNYALGLAATFNIGDYPRVKAEVSSERYRSKAIKEESKEQELIAASQIAQAEDELKQSIDREKEDLVLLSAAIQAYQQRLSMYNAGLANLTDLEQAAYTLTLAETEHAISINNIWKALLAKANASGDLNLILNQQ
jgi:outer membrane protein TolC